MSMASRSFAGVPHREQDMKSKPKSIGAGAGTASRSPEPASSRSAPLGDPAQAPAQIGLPMPALLKLQSNYVAESTAMWNQLLSLPSADAPAPARAADRRFSGQDWLANPAAAYMAQMYLLNARTLLQMADN